MPSHPWIIDSRASHHITGMSSLFFSYRVSSGRDKVRIVDGSLSSLVGTGYIPLTSLPLFFVFHVPNFQLNLVFVSHITKVLNCSVMQHTSSNTKIGVTHKH